MAKRNMTLRGSQEAFKTIVDTSLEGIYQVDNSGKFIFVNESFATLFGYGREELLGNHFADMLSADALPKVERMVQEVLAGKNVRDEVAVKHKDGHEIPVSFSAAPLREQGAIIGLTGVLSDISERKQAEEALREAHDQLGMRVKERTLELEKANEALKFEMGEHRRAEEAAKGITREFLTILENSVDMIYRLNLQSGTYDYLSPSSEIVLGYTPEEFIASGFENASTLVHPDDLEMLSQNILELIERAPEQTATGPIEYRMNHKQLGYRWVSDNRSIIYDDRNMPVAAIGILRDVTERKQAEQALQESERNYRVLFDSQIDGAAVVDAEKMKIVLVNETALKMYGFDSLEEALEVNLIDYIHPDDRDRILRIITEDMFEKDLRQVVEFRIITKDGRERWASAVGTRIEYQGKMAGLASFRDITEQKQAEEARQESERKFREMADLLPQTVLEIDKTGTLTFLNRMGFESSGYSQADFDKGLNSFKLLVPEDRERGKENLQLILNGEESIGTEYTALRKDGTTFPVILYSSPIIRDKQPVGLRAVAVDITERKQADEALRESEEKGRALLNAPPDSAILTDREGVILDLNEVAAERFGTTVDERIGVNIYDIVQPDVAKGR
ncbi:MAG: PAS domain S-box protein, partial [Dehalococcoidia bacterium]